MKLYTINDWEKFYEVSDSKKVDGPLSWVAVRTKQDGFGFRRMAEEKSRCELFAAWILMVQVSARQPRSERGRLVRDGRPLNAKSLATMTGFPEVAFAKSLEFFSSPEVGWLNVQEHGQSESVRIAPDQSGRGGSTLQDITLQDTEPPQPGGDMFAQESGTNAAAKTARPRNFVMDALGSVDGSDPLQITGPKWKAIAKAMADIRAVCPHVTPDEIQRRADNYRRHMPDVVITPSALAKHWAMCDQPPRGKINMTPPKAPTQEPANWKAFLNREFPDSRFSANQPNEARLWSDLDPETQRWLAAEIHKRGAQSLSGAVVRAQ